MYKERSEQCTDLSNNHVQGRTGIAVSTSKQAILVAHHGETHQAGNTTQTVEALKDYLVGQGY